MTPISRAPIIPSAGLRRVAGAALLALLLSACVMLPSPIRLPATPERAAAAAQRGDHATAAGMYESLATSAAPEARNDQLLLAATEWNAAGRYGEAERVLATLKAPFSNSQQQTRRLLEAELGLQSGQSQRAWQAVSALPVPSVPAAAAHYYDVKRHAALAAGRPVDAVRAHLAGVALVSDAAAQRKQRRDFLAELRAARDHGLKLDPDASNDVLVRGWLDLGAFATDQRGTSLSGGNDAARWRARYPNHPAAELLGDVFPATLTPSAGLHRVALLLPLTGRTAGPAATVRDGFQYAFNQLAGVNRPELAIYDTGAMSVGDAFAQARATGADFIVGPLTREENAAAVAGGAPSAPTLALNLLPAGQSAPGNWYQYALAPEDEARQIARYAIAAGQTHGVALAPNTEWGNRVLGAFGEELRAGNGVLLGTGTYDLAGADFGATIRSVLGTDQSYDRLRRLQTATGQHFEFEPRRRADLQFILAAAPSPITARLLRPQLRFQYAGSVPVYATADSFSPTGPQDNLDLGGLIVADIPWVVADSGATVQIRHDVETAFASGGTNFQSPLFAFGYDACQLMLAVSNAGGATRSVLVAGLTGQLSFDDQGRVQRQLMFARIGSNGESGPVDDARRGTGTR